SLEAIRSRRRRGGPARQMRRSLHLFEPTMNTTLSALPPDNPRKLALRERIDATLEEIERWRRFNAAYHDDDRKFMRFLVPPGKRVLELGCGSGHMLAALQPSYGVGVDFSQKAVARAKLLYPHLNFVPGDVENPATLEGIEGPFDY